VIPGASARSFFVPRHLTTSVQLAVPTSDGLTNYRFDSIYPPTYVLQYNTITWHGGSDFQPSFEATALSADQSRADDTFYSGLVLGIAAAALISLIQELPQARSSRAARSRARTNSSGKSP
jgi:hypothetical protein